MNEDLCKKLEAFQTQEWAVRRILDVELLPPTIIDPCVGLGMISKTAQKAGYKVHGYDIHDWGFKDTIVTDWLTSTYDIEDCAVIMNPPFSLACAFVSHAKKLNARKIVCFQRQAWRESGGGTRGRRTWWNENKPSRVWICGDRATCWRFDLLECPNGPECPNANLLGRKKLPGAICARCAGNTPTAHAWYVWERGHPAAEVTGVIYR